MNHCVLEVQVKEAPTIRYTQDNKTPIAEMEVLFEGLRTDDTPGELKVVGWGNMAQELQSRVKAGQRLILEGRLRMNTIPRADGTKEKRAELTLSKLHASPESSPLGENINHNSETSGTKVTDAYSPIKNEFKTSKNVDQADESISWNSAPLVPDTDDIPF